MTTGVKKDAFKNYGVGANQAGTSFGNANAIYDISEPELAAQAAHPGGYTPQQVAQQTTAAQQSAGGSMSGATGQGALLAARTRNAGAAQGAIQQSGRQASQNLSNAALKTQMSNADLQQKQRAQALSGLGSLEGQQGNLALGALGQSNEALNLANQAKPSFWQSLATTAAKNLVNAGLDSAEAAAGF